jgi:hypothetical protein
MLVLHFSSWSGECWGCVVLFSVLIVKVSAEHRHLAVPSGALGHRTLEGQRGVGCFRKGFHIGPRWETADMKMGVGRAASMIKMKTYSIGMFPTANHWSESQHKQNQESIADS